MKSRKLKDGPLIVISVLVAILLWVYIIGVQRPYIDKDFKNIHVDVNEAYGTTAGLGLTVLNSKENTVDIVLSGRRDEIAALKESDITAKIDISGIVNPGVYTLPVEVTLPGRSLELLSKNPEKITVKVDKITEVELPLTAEINYETMPENYILDSYEMNPTSVTIKGPDTEVKSVAYAKVIYSFKNLEKTQVISGDIKLFNEKNEEIKSDYITVSPSRASVKVPVLKTKEVPLDIEFYNPSDGQAVTNINYNINVKTITIAGDPEQIDAIESIRLARIDITTLDLSKDTTLSYDINLPIGIQNLTGTTSASVDILSPNFITQSVSINNFEISNKPAGETVNLITSSIEIKLRGKQEDITRALADGIKAVVDLQKQQRADGQYSIAVKIVFLSKKNLNVHVMGIYTVAVEIKNAA